MRLRLALAAVLAGGLALRLVAIDHGLPFAYNGDEELHFVPRAIAMFGGSLNPDYFENPPALTYLLHLLFRLRYPGASLGSTDIVAEYARDPGSAFLTARVLVALVGTGVCALVYVLGRRFADARAGLVAAALMATAFVPVFYSKQALNDVVALVPVCLGLVACLRLLERARPLDWMLAGAALGAATATKYTGAALLAALVAAAALRGREHARESLRGLAIAGAVAGAVFLALNPYAVLDNGQFRQELENQVTRSNGRRKLGQEDVPGAVYYLWTLTWGLGWLPLGAALAGAAIALRERARRVLPLLALALAVFVVMSRGAEVYARWMLPLYPVLAVLAGLAAARAAELAPRRLRAAALAALAALLCAQGLVQSARVDAVLARADTRQLARDWLIANVPPGTPVVVEPFVPRGFLSEPGRLDVRRYPRYPVFRPYQGYERELWPPRVDAYRRGGWCWVVVGSHQRDRGLEAGLDGARAYYARLARESARIVRFSPYDPGARPVEFNYDLSFNYLPRAYRRPGPEVVVHRLRGCP